MEETIERIYIGAGLRKARLDQGLNQQHIANLIGTNWVYVSEIEAGKVDKIEWYHRFAAVVGLKIIEE